MTKDKKTTDIASMLGTARRAEQVPRPAMVERAPEAPATVRRVNVQVDAGLHQRLKILSATSRTPIQELADEALTAFLASRQG